MSLHILVVDDEPDVELLIRQRFRRQIRADEFAFNFARDGVEALQILEEHPSIELVLSDINMPRMDGLTLLRHIAELNRLLKVVIVSAYWDLESIRTAMNRGAFDFITKPIDFSDLDATIAKTSDEILMLRKAILSERELTSLRRELDIARDIQLSFCPLEIKGQFSGARVHGLACPAKEVGGDFYDFFPLGGDRFGFAIGDVAGKGLGAALFMAVTRTMIRATALQQLSPSTVLDHVNAVLGEDAPARIFVTCIYGTLEAESGTVTYSNAGHNPPLLIREDGPPKMLGDVRGPALCLMKGVAYRENVLQLAPSDTLLLYTDGVTEAMGVNGLRFEEEGLLRSASEERIGEESLAARIMKSVRGFSVPEQHDDITLLAFGTDPAIVPQSSEHVRVEMDEH
jgi:phosphoserine phosphatase RsbU/P